MPAPKDPIKNQEWRKKLSEASKNCSQETRRKISEAGKGRIFSVEHRRKISKANEGNTHLLGYKHTEESRRKISEAGKKKVYSAESRRKISEAISKENHPRWKGGVSFEPYCVKFNKEFKERVRAFFGHCCIECGNPQNGKRLTVHHITYDKMVCCNNTKPLFACLCNSCNSKANSNRSYWQQHFTDIINNYYGGKCYLSREEFLCLFP